jgi:chaperonin GroEL
LITDLGNKRAQAENAALLISDLEIEEPEQLAPALRAAAEGEFPALVIMASKISDKITGLMVTNQKAGRLQLFAVKTPTIRSDDQQAAMQDLAVLTGGQPFIKAAGNTLNSVTPASLGQARRIWADMEYLGIVGGKGSPLDRRDWIKKLSIAYHSADEAEARNKLCERVGRLYSGSAVLWVGGMTESEIDGRKELASRTIQALRAALYEGVLPGGGAAFLACRRPLTQAMSALDDPDEQAALHILLAALEAPFRTIIQNAGFHPARALDMLEQAGPLATFDVTANQVASTSDDGVFDIAAVAKTVIHSAVLGASLALTIDAFVHRHKPPVVTEPD